MAFFKEMQAWGRAHKNESFSALDPEGEEQSEPDDDTLPTVSGRELKYPWEITYPIQPVRTQSVDPFAHLGPIGYTRNTWRTRGGPYQQAQNLLLGFHVKASGMKELARRMILAESIGGLPRDIDKDSLVSKEKYFYHSGKAPDRTRNRTKKNDFS